MDKLSRPKVILVCATPRSGSTYLCSLLRQTDQVGCCKEIISRNLDLEDRFPEIGFENKSQVKENFQSYITALLDHYGEGNSHVAFKVHGHQVIHWLTLGVRSLKQIQADYYIFLKRDSLLKQAISLEFVSQNKIYFGSLEGSKNPEYSTYALMLKELSIRFYNLLWKFIFWKNNISPCSVSYEELLVRQSKALNEVFSQMKITSNIDAENMVSKIPKQDSALKTRWFMIYSGERQSFAKRIGFFFYFVNKLVIRLKMKF